MTFDFSVPITWADIINVISTVVALGAVIVAIVANSKASQSLKYSLKMQEQSKNIDLFEKRVAIIDEIKKQNKAPKLHLELLFDKSITKEYEIMQSSFDYYMNSQHDMDVYCKSIECIDEKGDYTSPIAHLMDLENELETFNYPADKVSEFERLCEEYEITLNNSDGLHEPKLYNYKDLSLEISKSQQEFESQKEVVLTLMKSFIENSISSLD